MGLGDLSWIKMCKPLYLFMQRSERNHWFLFNGNSSERLILKSVVTCMYMICIIIEFVRGNITKLMYVV